MPEAINGEVTIHYLDEGTGEAVLLIHGHTQDRRIFDPMMGSLIGEGLRVIRPDLRGHGKSTRPDSGYHHSHHASDMLAVLDAADVHRASVVGYSVGGAIALEMAITHSDRVAGLVLASPVMPDRPFEPEFMDCIRQVARVARTEGIVAAMEGAWGECPLFTHSFTKAGIREAAEAITRDFPGAEYLATARDHIERTWTIPERLSEIDVPTIVLAGDSETSGFIDYAKEAAAGIPGSRLELLVDCGHLLPLEEPDRVAQAIIDVAQTDDPNATQPISIRP